MLRDCQKNGPLDKKQGFQGNCEILRLMVSITIYLLVIGFPRAYFLRNCSVVTWVSNYSCPILNFL